jgi:hypothetical protein
MMEAVHTSETSVNFNMTTRHIPENSKLHTRRRDNLKSHTQEIISNASVELGSDNDHVTYNDYVTRTTMIIRCQVRSGPRTCWKPEKPDSVPDTVSYTVSDPQDLHIPQTHVVTVTFWVMNMCGLAGGYKLFG